MMQTEFPFVRTEVDYYRGNMPLYSLFKLPMGIEIIEEINNMVDFGNQPQWGILLRTPAYNDPVKIARDWVGWGFVNYSIFHHQVLKDGEPSGWQEVAIISDHPHNDPGKLWAVSGEHNMMVNIVGVNHD